MNQGEKSPPQILKFKLLLKANKQKEKQEEPYVLNLLRNQDQQALNSTLPFLQNEFLNRKSYMSYLQIPADKRIYILVLSKIVMDI